MSFGNAVGQGFNNGEVTKLTVADLGPGDGIFVYTTATPAPGTLLASVTATAGTDSAGNNYLQGITVYTAKGVLQLGLQTIGASSLAAFFVSALANIPFVNPLFGGQASSTAGCVAEINSGQATAGGQFAFIDLFDNQAAGGQPLIELGATNVLLNSSAGQTIPAPRPAATAAAILAMLENVGISQ